MRYTEARLQKITQEVYLKDMDKDVAVSYTHLRLQERCWPVSTVK